MKWHFASVTSYNLSTISYDQFLTDKHKAHVRKLEDILYIESHIGSHNPVTRLIPQSIEIKVSINLKISRGFYWAKREHLINLRLVEASIEQKESVCNIWLLSRPFLDWSNLHVYTYIFQSNRDGSN